MAGTRSGNEMFWLDVRYMQDKNGGSMMCKKKLERARCARVVRWGG